MHLHALAAAARAAVVAVRGSAETVAASSSGVLMGKRSAVRRWDLIVALVALLVPGRAQGQAIADLPAGARVRITLPDSARPFPFTRRARFVIATVARATTDTLWVQIGGPDTVRVPRGAIRKVEVSRGVSRARSALELGLLFGVEAGLLVATHHDRERGEKVAIGVSAVVVGALIGAVSPYERWRRVR